jgi:hypothetical protein
MNKKHLLSVQTNYWVYNVFTQKKKEKTEKRSMHTVILLSCSIRCGAV